MNRVAYLLLAVACCLVSFSAAARADNGPVSIVGIKLGTPVSEYKELIKEGSTLRMWDQEYLSRVELKHIPGMKSGYLSFANCDKLDTVVRIKLKYDDSSVDFFQKMYKALEKKYGTPQNRGNPFGTLKVWKWALTSPQGHAISLILTHNNGKDDEYSYGNTLRLADRTLIDHEAACYRLRQQEEANKHPAPPVLEKPKSFDWYLPR